MGLFQQKGSSKKSSVGDVTDNEKNFFDEYFREELRNHGRWYFEKIISENGELFKKELDTTIERINNESKEYLTKRVDEMVNRVGSDLSTHVTSRVNEQVAEQGRAMKEAQDKVLEEINHNVTLLRDQSEQLTDSLRKSIAEQEGRNKSAVDEFAGHMRAMKDAQDSALASINESTEALKQQHKHLTETLEEQVGAQKSAMVGAFQENMAYTIEHYLLEALSDQYDLKAQLPAILKQMDDNKEAIVDDIKL